ncbi:MAG TPA: hypothetical protein VD867_06470, partial [Burkholderiales bacterium]|nr:hypothetical protein [Burkholderiales bacterium]
MHTSLYSELAAIDQEAVFARKSDGVRAARGSTPKRLRDAAPHDISAPRTECAREAFRPDAIIDACKKR